MAGYKMFPGMSEQEMLHYMQIGEKKEEMFEALQAGSGIKGILNIAYTCLENPMTVCDTSFSILECCPEHINEMDFEIRNNKQYMKPEAVLSMHREKLVERIFSEKTPFTFYRDALGFNIMYCQISIQKNVVGYVCVLAKNREFVDDDFEIVAALSQMLSVEMQKSSFFTEKTGFKYGYFLSDLVEGGMKDRAFIEQRMIQLGRKPMKHYWIMAAMFEDEKGLHISHQYYSEQLITIIKNSMAFFYKGHILILVSSDEKNPYDDRELFKLTDFLRLNRMYLAVSHRFLDVVDAPEYYRQTSHLLKMMQYQDIDTRILKYEDFTVACVAGIYMKPSEREAAIHPDIKFLIDYDLKNKTEYLETLKIYLENDRNAVKSAAALHIHKSTFFYRMSKICEMLDIAMDDGRRMFDYEFSMQLLAIKKDKMVDTLAWLDLESSL